MRPKHLRILFLLAIIACISTGCKRPQPYHTYSGMVWNTVFNISYDSDLDLDDSIAATLRSVEMSLSPFKPESLISAINRNESDSADSRILTVFSRALEVNRWSGGAFDPTVAPLINLWGFGYGESVDAPTDEMIDSCLRSVGMSECLLEGSRIIKKSAATEFNFSAITKGYGCDAVGRMLRRNGVENYMVEIGGEIALAGKSPRGGNWRVMVDAPIDTTAYIHKRLSVIDVTDCGIATSGNYRNFREADGKKFGHTISPVTGRPIKTEILSATVVAPDAMTADALATAAMAMPADSVLAMFDRLGKSYGVLLVKAGAAPDEWECITGKNFPEINE